MIRGKGRCHQAEEVQAAVRRVAVRVAAHHPEEAAQAVVPIVAGHPEGAVHPTEAVPTEAGLMEVIPTEAVRPAVHTEGIITEVVRQETIIMIVIRIMMASL